MIAGVIPTGREALIDLELRGPAGSAWVVGAIIDTGFVGFLTLPMSLVAKIGAQRIGQTRVLLADGSETILDLYEVQVLWDGRWISVEADAVEAAVLVGMDLLAGFRLCLDVVAGGGVTVEALV